MLLSAIVSWEMPTTREEALDAFKVRGLVKKKIKGLGDDPDSRDLRELRKTLSAAETVEFDKLKTASSAPSCQAENVFLDNTARQI